MLLHMMTGSKEDAETVTAFFEDMKRRGLNDPLLVTSDDRKRSCDQCGLHSAEIDKWSALTDWCSQHFR